MNIEFHDLENLRKVAVKHSVAPARPSRLFTTRPALLSYIDYSTDLPRVRSVDCSALPSKPKTSGVSISTQKKELWAFDACTGGFEWTVKGKLPGMEKEMCAEALASDGHGILFVCDTNNSCVEMFSANGTFMHVFLRGRTGAG